MIGSCYDNHIEVPTRCTIKVTIRKIGKVRIIELNGKLVLGTAQNLAEAFKTLVTDKQKCILIDLRKVPYMDSSGIGEVAACRKRAKDKQVDPEQFKFPGTILPDD